jgi:ferredoxin-NADP reductase
MRWEAEDVVSVLLESEDGSNLPPWTPGAHLDLILPNGLVRNYSLSNAALTGDERSTWRIAVLKEPDGGGGSQYVHDSLRVGQVIRGHGPRNNFVLEPAPSYLFIAGGIGITPILPMISKAVQDGIPWQLLYGGRKRASMAFLDELADFTTQVTIHPQDEAGLLPLSEWAAEPVAGRLIYCCGPGPLLDAVEKATEHWPQGSLVIERFRPLTNADPEAAAHDLPGGTESFEVVAARTGISVHVPAGTTILAALEKAGIDVPNSCREGICGTCETPVLDGVPVHRDSLLSPEERASNQTMMPCISRCSGPRLVLDL